MNFLKAISIVLSATVIVSCAAHGTNEAAARVEDDRYFSAPNSFFVHWKERVVVEVNAGVSIIPAAKANVEERKRAATQAAQAEISKLRSAEVMLPEDCYADMVCFNEEMAISLFERYGAEWSASLQFLEPYFAAALADIREVDLAVDRAVDVEVRLSEFIRRDQLLREIYGRTLNDPVLEQHSPLTRDLGIGWIRSQVRQRDIAASDWLMNAISSLPDKQRIALLEKSWLIIQHADRRPALQDLAVAALEAGSFPQQNPKEWAMLVDRLELNLGNPQIYATQVRCIDGEFRFSPTIDDSAVNQRRATLGIGPIRGEMSNSLGPC